MEDESVFREVQTEVGHSRFWKWSEHLVVAAYGCEWEGTWSDPPSDKTSWDQSAA